MLSAHICLFPLALNNWVGSWVHRDNASPLSSSGGPVFHDLDLSVEDKDLISSILPSSDWAWKGRGRDTAPHTPLSWMETALLLHELAHTSSSKINRRRGTPPNLHEPRGSQKEPGQVGEQVWADL